MGLATNWPRPVQIIDYYRRSREVIGVVERHSESSLLDPGSRFFAMTPRELTDALESMSKELEHQAVLMLTASFEAELQRDVYSRQRRKQRDPISIELGGLLQSCVVRHRRIQVPDIVAIWRKHTGLNAPAGHFLNLVKLRHWLAHGRYWTQKTGMDADVYEAWQCGKGFFDRLPGFPPVGEWS